MIEYKTKEVAQLLKVSEPSVRNYAKMLEKYGHEFIKRRQARIWTDKEISLIREILNIYEEGSYELETCFQYVVAKGNVGEEKASELLENPIDFEEGIRASELQRTENNILSAIENMKLELKEEEQLKIEYDNIKNETNKLEQKTKELERELEIKENEQDDLQKKYIEVKDELTKVLNMSVFEFYKYKRM